MKSFFKSVSKNKKDYDDFHKANKNTNIIVKAMKAKKTPSKKDYDRLGKELDKRADAASRVFKKPIISVGTKKEFDKFVSSRTPEQKRKSDEHWSKVTNNWFKKNWDPVHKKFKDGVY